MDFGCYRQLDVAPKSAYLHVPSISIVSLRKGQPGYVLSLAGSKKGMQCATNFLVGL